MPLRRKIPLPKKFGGSKPGALKPADWNRMVDSVKAIIAELTDLSPQPSADIGIRQSSGGWVAYLKRRISGGSRATPYKVSLITTPGSPPTYEVTVGWGYVCERIPGPGDAVAYHEAANMWDTVDATKLRKHPITVGQAVYIRTEVDEDGKVGISEGDAVVIEIAADEASSTHYEPKVDDLDSEGDAGHCLYKLAVLKAPVAPSTTPNLEKWLTGSHLDHYQELPAIKSTLLPGTDIGVVPKEWSESEKAYKLRAIRGLCGVKVTQTTDEIQVKTSGNSFRVRIWETIITVAEDGDYYPTIDIDAGPSPSQEFWVLNGVWHLTQPDNWSDCGGSSEPVYDVSWVLPTTGGPTP